MRRKTICILAALGAVLGGGILLGSTVSASAAELETPDVPVATAVTSMTGEPGWQNEYGVRRYFDESGNAVTGEQEIDGVYYLFDYTGVQKTGWRTVNGVRRYYDPETGEMVSGWLTYCDNRYYADEETGKQTGEFQKDGKRYLLDDTYGQQQLGLCTFADKTTSYYDEDGEVLSGWVTADSGKVYYFDSNYAMQTGWQNIGGEKYYFASDGVMQTEWQMIGGKLYYFGYDGAMQKNKEVFCYYDSEHWGNYYLQSDGSGISVVCYRLNQATLKPHYSFVVYNRQTKNHSQWTTYISDKDKQILQNFINKNFKKGMTREQQLWTTLNWIHTNVEYAYVQNGAWAQITNKSYVDAIFTYRKGQCIQYNAAIASMMAYLGYDVNLVQGWVGGVGNQHFWCEVHINGKTYVMETGNEGKNGSWMHFLDPYSDATEYVQY